MKCKYCKREFNEIEAFNAEMSNYFKNILGMNNYRYYDIIPDDVEEVQCFCGAYNKIKEV